ncbi:MAG: hypothetical protein VZQ80_07535 [Lachnospiraceae bacterium]|nr:hypothetical protein [Lachnospiraceae bacterium]
MDARPVEQRQHGRALTFRDRGQRPVLGRHEPAQRQLKIFPIAQRDHPDASRRGLHDFLPVGGIAPVVGQALRLRLLAPQNDTAISLLAIRIRVHAKLGVISGKRFHELRHKILPVLMLTRGDCPKTRNRNPSA